MSDQMAAKRSLTLQDQMEDLAIREKALKEQKKNLLMAKGWDAFRALSDFKMALNGLSVPSPGTSGQDERISEFLSWLSQEFSIEAPPEVADGILREGI